MSIYEILLTGLLFVSIFHVRIETASAQTKLSYYYVTVNPTAPGLMVHSTTDWNWTVSFQAIWTYGDNSGQTIENATVSIEVRTTDSAVMKVLLPKTNAAGFVSFYYSCSTPNVLTFVPTKLVTEDGVEWNQSLIEDAHSLYGFQSESITIYWDSFEASLVNTVVDSVGITHVSVNVTYLMIPEEGLAMPRLSNRSQYDYVSKYVDGADVRINGIRAEESSVPGVYTAKTCTWLPTAYVLVEISQEEWRQTHKAFSFTHNANEVVWASATLLGFICTVVGLTYHFVLSKKANGHALSKEAKLLVVSTILLAVASFISIYWALVGLENFFHGFDWLLLGLFGIVASAFGLAGSLMSKRRKNYAFTVISLCFPLLENTAIVKYSFDNYQLPIPWMVIISAFTVSTLGGILIGRSNEEFS